MQSYGSRVVPRSSSSSWLVLWGSAHSPLPSQSSGHSGHSSGHSSRAPSSLQVPVLLLCRLSPWSSKTQDALPISASLKTSGFWSGRLETHRTRYITCKKLPAACEVFLARNSPSLEARSPLKNRLIRRNIYFFRSYGSTVVLYEVLVRRRNSPLFAFS